MNKNLISRVIFVVAILGILILSLSNLSGFKNRKGDENKDPKKTQLVIHGNNSFGQLGEPSYVLGTGFNNIYFDEDISDFAVGRNYSLVLTKAGKVISWGGNEWGQLGYGFEELDTYYSTERREIPNLGNQVKKVSTTNNHSLLLLDNGTVAAFGSNFSGQLGSGDNKDNPYPRIVNNLTSVKDIAAGYKFSVALKDDGSVWGWGATCDEKTKREAETWWETVISGFDSIDGGYYDPSSDALAKFDKNEYCINEEVVGILSKVPVKIENLTNVVSLTAGYGHVLALDQEGRVWSFGCNTYKQLGRNVADKSENALPSIVPNLEDVKQVSAGYRHSLALKNDGTVWGWGISNHGQLGVNSPTEIQPDPVKVPIDNVKIIVAAYDYSLALKNDGTVWGWGINRQGLFGSIETEYVVDPVKLDGFHDIEKISASAGHIIALPKTLKE